VGNGKTPPLKIELIDMYLSELVLNKKNAVGEGAGSNYKSVVDGWF